MISYKNGTLSTHCGDSYQITANISGLAPNCEYNIYYQVNCNPNLVKSQEVKTDAAGHCCVIFEISVEENSKIGTFSYGIKVCRDDKEDTVKSGDLIVSRKIVEGTL